MEDTDKRTSAIVHLYGVSLAATILAKKRGLDEELAAMAAMLHDMHAYKTGSYDDHAHKGADLAREILGELNLTTPEETDIICSAIYHHDDKHTVDSPMDELLKDADVIHHTMNDSSKAVKGEGVPVALLFEPTGAKRRQSPLNLGGVEQHPYLAVDNICVVIFFLV